MVKYQREYAYKIEKIEDCHKADHHKTEIEISFHKIALKKILIQVYQDFPYLAISGFLK